MSGEHTHSDYESAINALEDALGELQVRVEALEDSPVPEPEPESPEGAVNLFVYASSGFDKWTENPSEADKQAMAHLYDFMVVWSPWRDSVLEYLDAYEYTDMYGIKDTFPRYSEHPEWILKDANGKKLYLDYGCKDGKCPQWAGDVGNPAFRKDMIDNEFQDAWDTGYPGFHIDDLNMRPSTTDGSGDFVAPINPRTGKIMLLSEWRYYVATFMEEIREAFPEAIISTNPIWYLDSPDLNDANIDRQAAATDIWHFERGINDNGLTGGTGKYSVDALFRQVDRIHRFGCSVAWRDETGTTDALQEYNLAAYFMVSNGTDYVSTEQWTKIAYDSLWYGFKTDLGAALGPRTKSGGVFKREFEKGTVFLAEPGASANLTISGRDLKGNAVSNPSISAKRGLIVLKESQ